MDIPVDLKRLDLYAVCNDPLEAATRPAWQQDMDHLTSMSAVLSAQSAEARDEKECLQRRVAKLYEELLRISAHEERIHEALNVVGRAGSVARELPTEVISMIIFNCVEIPLTHKCRTVLANLASTSRRFRNIVHSRALKSLWSNVCFDLHLLDDCPTRLLEVMKNMGKSPLRLVVHTGLKCGRYSQWLNWGEEELDENIDVALFKALADSGVKIDDLFLGGSILQNIDCLCQSGQGRLKLGFAWANAVYPHALPLDIARPQQFSLTDTHPELEHLFLYDDSPDAWSFTQWVPSHSTLGSLHLEYLTINKTSEWLCLASALPRLRHLFLQEVQFSVGEITAVTCATFGSLTHLTASDSDPRFLGCSICPSLELLSIPQSDISGVPRFMEKNRPHLTETLVIWANGDQDLTKLVDSLPYVEQIIVVPLHREDSEAPIIPQVLDVPHLVARHPQHILGKPRTGHARSQHLPSPFDPSRAVQDGFESSPYHPPREVQILMSSCPTKALNYMYITPRNDCV
ncbi:hypothetical protein BKA70DRAFT_1445604 [Coprinopsis sp. MPI-PUGE-AT-0042]|nr:hypothetical protein BKA70DRAFT_1445604 [Coprinopsis sp. MPI-PUGE-AT-0042]